MNRGSPFIICFLGFWLLTSHFALGYHSPLLIWSDSVAGALLFILGFLAIPGWRAWVPWAIALVGVWLEAAPILFWAPDASCYLNDTLIGALVIAFSILIPEVPGILPDRGPSIPPGWQYNPSSWPQRLPIAFLASIGWFISRYLAAYQLGYIDQMWDPVFGMGTIDVITSKVSRSFPVSDAGLWAMAYTLEALLACKGGERRWRTMPWMVTLFIILVVPLGLTSILLIILQPIAVGAWCFLCLITATCMLIMVPLALDEAVAVIQYLRKSDEKPFWKLFFQGGLCPGSVNDERTPSLDAPFREVCRAAVWGTTFRKSLFFSALVGAWLMLTPYLFDFTGKLADGDHILGPFIIVASIVSFADVAYKTRFLNFFFSFLLFALSLLFWSHQSTSLLMNHWAIVALVFFLNRIGK